MQLIIPTGIEFIVLDKNEKYFVANINNSEKTLKVDVFGSIISKKQKGTMEVINLYEFLYEKIENLLDYINHM